LNKHKFSKAERYAVWKTHSAECFWCGEPIVLKHTTVDHIFPESLLDNPQKLEWQIAHYALPKAFDINGFENWVPAHASCNSKKQETIYGKSQVMLSIIERVQRKASQAQKTHDVVVRSQSKSDILGRLEAMIEQQQVTKEELVELFAETETEAEQVRELADDVISRLSSRWAIVSVDHNLATASDGRIAGITWVGKQEPDSSWQCWNCGFYGPWSGARCLSCGQLSDD